MVTSANLLSQQQPGECVGEPVDDLRPRSSLARCGSEWYVASPYTVSRMSVAVSTSRPSRSGPLAARPATTARNPVRRSRSCCSLPGHELLVGQGGRRKHDADRRGPLERVRGTTHEQPQRLSGVRLGLHRQPPVGELGRQVGLPHHGRVDHGADQLGLGVEDEVDGLRRHAGPLGDRRDRRAVEARARGTPRAPPRRSRARVRAAFSRREILTSAMARTTLLLTFTRVSL